MDLRKCLGLLLLTTLGWLGAVSAQTPLPEPPPLPGVPASAAAAPSANGPEVVQLEPGDQIRIDVYGHPEMGTLTYVGGNGNVRVPLAGDVNVAGLSPAAAAQKIETALVEGQYFKQAHVTIAVQTSQSKVSVIGEVRTPGRYQIEANSTVLDVLALAGGRTEKADDVVFLLRQQGGDLTRHPIDLKGLSSATDTLPDAVAFRLRGGDSIVVPAAHLFYISGEIRNPNTYRLEANMTVLQAVSVAGGITDKGSLGRIYIKRKQADGSYKTLKAEQTELVQADDVITCKERIF